MDGPTLIKASTFFRIPVRDGRRLAAMGIKECSRLKFSTDIPTGADCYVMPLAGTGYWMAYVEGGAVLKMTSAAAARYLVADRQPGGRVVYDRSGRGLELWAAQNRRAGDRPRHASGPGSGPGSKGGDDDASDHVVPPKSEGVDVG